MTTLPLRDRRNALLFGICAGLARRTATPAWAWRTALVLSLIVGMGLPAVAYVIMAWLVD